MARLGSTKTARAREMRRLLAQWGTKSRLAAVYRGHPAKCRSAFEQTDRFDQPPRIDRCEYDQGTMKRAASVVATALGVGLFCVACTDADDLHADTPFGSVASGGSGLGGAQAIASGGSGLGGAQGMLATGGGGIGSPLPAGGTAGQVATSTGGLGGAPPSTVSEGGAPSGPIEIIPGIIAEPDDEAAFLWQGDILRTFELNLSETDLAFLDANPSAEEYVNGELRFDGEVYDQVGIRYKRSVGAFLQPCTNAKSLTVATGPRVGKCSIKVSFDWVDPEGRFHGLRKLQFHSLGKDASLMRERLGYSMFREMGLAAPRAVHARVLINGQYAGIYALVEDIDGRFTRSRFVDGGEGNLYKEVWPVHDDAQSYLDALQTNEDENPSVQQMLDFKSAIDQGSAAADAWLDPDLIVRYLAVDRVIINDDGIMHFYCTPGLTNVARGFGNHNYYWYFAADEPRVWLIPWDLDIRLHADGFAQVYTEWDDTTVECTCRSYSQQVSNPLGQFPPSCDPLISGWATHLDAYNRTVDAFITGPFSAENVNPKLNAWTEQIRSAVEEQAAAGIIAYEDDVLTTDAWQTALSNLQVELQSMRENRGYPY